MTARVVSVPCKEWFLRQDISYRETVLPPSVRARVVIEAAASFGWHDLLGESGRTVTVDTFGLSAPAGDALRETGMTEAAVLRAAEDSSPRRPGSELR